MVINVTDNNLLNEILGLVHLKQEGAYWDFKKEWHEKKADLLHDIICMANNLVNRDAYIIIGVDEDNDYNFNDVSDDCNRKNTQNIVDFLKDKKFAGGIRPTVYVQELEVKKYIIDVIVVKNSTNTPFYLTEKFEGVFANQIYTRIMDTNTPKTNSADIDKIEYLWKKRFHLDETPIQKFYHYIDDYRDWVASPIEYDMSKYYKFAPEFTITSESDESRTGYEYYLFSQLDSRPHWYLVTLKYHQTPLEQFQGIGLDGGRCFVIAPNRAIFSFDKYHKNLISYSFYVKTSHRYKLNTFFLRTEPPCENYQYESFCDFVLFFDTEEEQNDFQDFVTSHQNLFNEIYPKYESEKPIHYEQIKGYKEDAFLDNYRNVLTLKDMLSVFWMKTKSF